MQHARKALDNSRWNHRNDPPSDSPELAMLGLLTDEQLLDAEQRVPLSLLSTPVRLLKVESILRLRSLPVYEELPPSSYVEFPYNEMDNEKWSSVCMVSWRWPEMKPARYNGHFSPMPEEQLARFQKALKKQADSETKGFLWIDWCCAPQYTSDPLVEIARSRLFYARAATLIVIPDFKTTRPAGMMKEALGNLQNALLMKSWANSSMDEIEEAYAPPPMRSMIPERPSSARSASSRMNLNTAPGNLERQRSRSVCGEELASCVLGNAGEQLLPLPSISPASVKRGSSRFAQGNSSPREGNSSPREPGSRPASHAQGAEQPRTSNATEPLLQQQMTSVVPGISSLPAIQARSPSTDGVSHTNAGARPMQQTGALPSREVDASAQPTEAAPMPGGLSEAPSMTQHMRAAVDEADTSHVGCNNEQAETVQLFRSDDGHQAEVMQINQTNENGGLSRAETMSGHAAETLLRSLPSAMLVDSSDDDYRAIARPVPPPQPPSREALQQESNSSSSGFTPVHNRPKTSARPMSANKRPGTSSGQKSESGAPPVATPAFNLGALQPAVVKSRPETVAPPSTAAPSWVKRVTGAETVPVA